MVYENILEAMGHTPLVHLRRLSPTDGADIYVKYEGLNVGGSVKTRVAYNMLERARKRGDIDENTIICEPTSGNQGIGLSLVGAVLGYKVCIIMPDSVSEERHKLCRAYGAQVKLVHDDGDIGKCIDECLKTAQAMAAEDPNVYIPQQFVNVDNPMVHRYHTGLEILEDMGDKIHGFCSGVGTGGTLSGVGATLRNQYPDILIWAVEPENAAILSGGGIGTHLQMGIGDGLIPDNLDTKIYSEVCVISDEEALDTSRRLAREEGLMCGISSGSNVAAAIRMARVLGPGKRVVTILPDTGERYFSTPLFEEESNRTF